MHGFNLNLIKYFDRLLNYYFFATYKNIVLLVKLNILFF